MCVCVCMRASCKSLWFSLTLCDPMDQSPCQMALSCSSPGKNTSVVAMLLRGSSRRRIEPASPVPPVLQADSLPYTCFSDS